MTANDIDKQVAELVSRYDPGLIMEHLDLVGVGQLQEVKDETGRPNRYYKWLACLMKFLKPKQVVELGAAAGISTIMMATSMDRSSKLYSVDIDPAAWRWMKHDYPQVIKILGDDLDLSAYPGDCQLSDTDVWFIDSLHTEEQLRKEFDLYRPFWKKGAIVVLDDIRLPGLDKIWAEITEDKCDNTIPNHYSGFGFFVA